MPTEDILTTSGAPTQTKTTLRMVTMLRQNQAVDPMIEMEGEEHHLLVTLMIRLTWKSLRIIEMGVG